ncbi:hypothetical protein [Pectobacterium polaris]|uniref:hypothetical protein n=1 Tax=Pectobacterium polaris TaxID=2042057 RepID=UPI00202D3F7E|nr:hypothetical protein [Pectobacterium polaris]MCL6327687.1 hypothetical protein [Pectobacterium polaris]
MPENPASYRDVRTESYLFNKAGNDSVKEVEALGFLASGQFMVKTIKNESEKLELIKSLAKVDALFVFGYGWYPSEVMDFYKEKNAYIGKYKVISWSDPNHYNIEER